MTLVIIDNAKETTTTTGTGSFMLLGAVQGFQSLAIIGNGNITYYSAKTRGATEWEVGVGTYIASGTMLVRTTVLSSSNGGALVNFSAGIKDVMCVLPAEKAVIFDANGAMTNFAGTSTLTLPTGTDTLVGRATVDTLSNKTLVAPSLGTPAGGNLINCTFPQLSANAGSTLVTNITGGTGAVGRTIASKLNETISVKDYGALGDGSHDDTTNIQAAIDANPGKVIRFPSGVYVITATILVNTDNTVLEGDGVGKTYIKNMSSGLDAVRFYCSNTASTLAYVSNQGLRRISIYRTTYAATGSGLSITQGNQFLGEEFVVLDHPEGLAIYGGQQNMFNTFWLQASSVLVDSPVANSSLLKIAEAPITGGLWQRFFTSNFSNFSIGAGYHIDACILMTCADGAVFTNGYIAGGYNALLRAKVVTANLYVAAAVFNNVYFDATNVTGTAVDFPLSAVSPGFLYGIVFNGCTIANSAITGVYVRQNEIQMLQFSNCQFLNTYGWAIDVSSSVTYLQLMLIGCQFNYCGYVTTSTGGIKAAGGNTLSITSNSLSSITNTGAVALAISGTWGSVAVNSNIFLSNATDYTNTATINGTRTLIGNTSSQANSPVKTVLFDPPGNATITPTISFGGASVGVTYGTQTGRYTRIGNFITFQITLILTSKGSSTGTLVIGGLPTVAATDSPVDIRASALTNGVGDTALSGMVFSGSTGFSMYKIVSGYATALTDADILNTFQCRIQGSYFV